MDRAAMGQSVAAGRRRDQSVELSLGASAHSQGSRSPRGRAGAWKVMLVASHPLFQDVVFSLFPPLSFTAMSHCRARASPGQGQTSCWVPMRCPSSSTPQDGQTSHASSYPCSRRPCSFSQERWDQQHGSSEGWSQFEGWFCCSFKPGVFI